MVQIIPAREGEGGEEMQLYIPHGSDNTNEKFTKRIRNTVFFISHMVQIIPF